MVPAANRLSDGGKQVTHTGRQESKKAELVGKNAAQMSTATAAAAVTLGEESSDGLKVNGGLNLHTPTISVCKKING